MSDGKTFRDDDTEAHAFKWSDKMLKGGVEPTSFDEDDADGEE